VQEVSLARASVQIYAGEVGPFVIFQHLENAVRWAKPTCELLAPVRSKFAPLSGALDRALPRLVLNVFRLFQASQRQRQLHPDLVHEGGKRASEYHLPRFGLSVCPAVLHWIPVDYARDVSSLYTEATSLLIHHQSQDPGGRAFSRHNPLGYLDADVLGSGLEHA